MTEVMVHSLLEGGFSFNGAKFSHIQPTKNEGEASDAQKSESDENLKEKNMEFDSDGAVSKLDAHTAIENSALTSKSNESELPKNTPDSNDNLVSKEDNITSEDNKILETETTMENTTDNLITKPTTNEMMDMTTGVEQSSRSDFPDVKTEAEDKSKVIVQVLKSNKSQNEIQSKSSNTDGQSTPSFRDDLCKLLSKSHTSKLEDANNTVAGICPEFSFYRNGRGIRIRDLKNVYGNMRQANPASLRYLHYLLFNKKPLSGSGMYLKARKNIGGFRGYPFKRSSEKFDRKIKYLNKISHEMLTGIYQAIFGNTVLFNRSIMIDQLLDFIWKPRECSDILEKYECEEKLNLTEEEYAALKESALKGSAVSVALEKLSENDIKQHISDNTSMDTATEECTSTSTEESQMPPIIKSENEQSSFSKSENEQTSFIKIEREQPSFSEGENEQSSFSEIKREQPSFSKGENEQPSSSKRESTQMMEEESSRTIPAFILHGPGKKLKCFSRIVFNVRNAHEKAIKILHYILYGRIEPSVSDCRRNILEFNGFSDCQQEFAAERRDIINRLDKSELFELCKILCLRGKTNSRDVRIKKIFEYLQSPTKPVIRKSLIEPPKLPTPVSPRVCRVETYSPKHSPYKTYRISQWPIPTSPRINRLDSSLPKRSPYRGVCRRRGRGRSRRSSSIFRSFNSGFERPQLSVTYPLSPADCPEAVFKSDGWKLRDFKIVCSNIECASPSDLIELNDLLFLKTCDESDIHQKILDFQGFKFPINSFHYDSRKTLMHYMGFCVVRKIARLLDIENWDNITNPEDLSSNVLKFLMDRKDLSCVKYLTPTPRFVLEDSPNLESDPPAPSDTVLECSDFVKPSAPLSPNSFLESNCTTEPSPLSSKSLLESTIEKEPSSSSSFLTDSSFVQEPLLLPPSSKSLPENYCVKEPSTSSLPTVSLFQSSRVNEPTPSSSDKSFSEKPVSTGPSVPQFSYSSSKGNCDVQSLPSSAVISKCNPSMPKSFRSEFFQQTNQGYTHHKKKVIIQRLTKASVQTQEVCQSGITNDKSIEMHVEESFKPDLTCVNSVEDDSIRLRDLIHHPTEQELKDLIHLLVKENLWNFTLGDLVQKVFECYPKVNLTYRENFIKSTARQMLSELRDYAVSAVKDNAF